MHVLLQYNSQKVITLSGRRFITVSGGFITLSGSYYSIGRFYYIIGQLLQYRAFITLSVGTAVFTRATFGLFVGSAPILVAHESRGVALDPFKPVDVTHLVPIPDCTTIL